MPAFKLTQNCGRSDIMKGLGGPNNAKFYQAWTQFIKLAQAWPGEFTHVLNMDAKPLAIYTTTEAIKLVLRNDSPIKQASHRIMVYIRPPPSRPNTPICPIRRVIQDVYSRLPGRTWR